MTSRRKGDPYTKYVGMGVHTEAAVRNSAGKVTKESTLGNEEGEDHSHTKGLARTLRKAGLDVRKYARRPAGGKFFP